MVFFVGSNPSPKNSDPNVAFVGTQSHRRLLDWISRLGVKKYALMNVSNQVTDGGLPKIQPEDVARLSLLPSEAIVIALGNFASNVLKQADVTHFKLPHPSGRNRLLNDERYVAARLKECGEFLKSVQK